MANVHSNLTYSKGLRAVVNIQQLVHLNMTVWHKFQTVVHERMFDPFVFCSTHVIGHGRYLFICGVLWITVKRHSVDRSHIQLQLLLLCDAF